MQSYLHSRMKQPVSVGVQTGAPLAVVLLLSGLWPGMAHGQQGPTRNEFLQARQGERALKR
ncbi:MAG: hypothetical protein V3U35_08060, partial [Candidatus Neomarinimicrobiota bacterium]